MGAGGGGMGGGGTAMPTAIPGDALAIGNAVPQCLQNLYPGKYTVPQFGQNMEILRVLKYLGGG
jgi:hypothetical protein